jgi:hypothetical protein
MPRTGSSSVILGLVIIMMSGCLGWQHIEPRKSVSQSPFNNGPISPDAVALEYAILDLPAGDRVANQEAWKHVDELVLGVDQRALLEANGIRVGVIAGALPSELQEQIRHPRHEQTIRRRQMIADEQATLMLHNQLNKSPIQLISSMDIKPADRPIDEDQANLIVIPHREADGRVRVQVSPELSAQQTKNWLPGADGANWSKVTEGNRFNQIGFEVTINPGEYLIMGARIDKENSIGDRLFFSGGEKQRRQKLFILRAYVMDKVQSATMNDAPGRNFETITPE